MSTTVSVSNYEYQGQVFSPAFSEPASPVMSEGSASPPMSPRSDDGEDFIVNTPDNRKRSSDASLEADDDQWLFVTKRPKYANKYEAMLQPLPSVISYKSKRKMPSKTHQSPVDPKLQRQFHNLVGLASDAAEVEDFLARNSSHVDVDRFNEEGRTAFQQCCVEGNLDLAKILVKYGANSRLSTRDGFSPFHLAVYAGHLKIMMYIMQLTNNTCQ